MKSLRVDGLDRTMAVAGLLGTILEAPLVIGLEGDIGAGKTTFVRGLVDALPGGERARVSSPTWAVLQRYDTVPVVHHLDLYRLADDDDLEGIAFRELLSEVVLLEWPERVERAASVIDVRIRMSTPDGPLSELRNLAVAGRSERGGLLVERWLALIEELDAAPSSTGRCDQA